MPVTAVRPVVERIAMVIFDRLQLLAAGYSEFLTVVEVVRPTRMGGYTPKHLQLVLSQDDPEELPGLSRPGNPPAVANRVRFNVHCHVMPSEKDPTPVDEYINAIAGDVIKVVTDPASSWHTMDGLAFNARIGATESIGADGGVDGVNVPVEVDYRVTESNPFEVRS